MAESIEARARFDFIRYANCWEDADVLCAALAPAPGKRMLSIASAGDNAFALLAEGAQVVAADLNPAQIACVELKRAAIQYLEREEALAFLGIAPSDKRLLMYAMLRSQLSPWAQRFWDGQAPALARGFIHCGKFERYFHLFRRWILPLVAGRAKVERLLTLCARAEQVSFYAESWNTWRWRLLFKLFFSRELMGRLGRDPEFFRYVEGSVSARILERARYALTELPTDRNPYLHYILTGNFGSALPRYLRPEHYDRVRANLDRLSWFLGPLQQAATMYRDAGFDGFNLSDIFEYLDERMCTEVYDALLLAARPGARFAYWNMLVPRRCPAHLAAAIRSHPKLAEELFAQDLAFFYSAFVLEEKR